MMTTLSSAGGGLPRMTNLRLRQETGPPRPYLVWLAGRGDRRQADLAEKLSCVRTILASVGRVVVAFSGGVDSTLVAKLARDVLGRANALAVTADSPSLAREDLAATLRLAAQLDLEHLVIATREVADARYRVNTESRCYFCKQELFEELERLAEERGMSAVLYGAIADDRLAERPGQRAALAFGVRAPLQDAGLAKWDVRLLARSLGLPNWNRPQNACLSSRIPHGMAVTEEKLRQVEQAESVLRAQGFRQVRVRHLGGHARIEVEPESVGRFQEAALCLAVSQRFEELGFDTVSIDRSGYRQGGADVSAVDEVLLTAISNCGGE